MKFANLANAFERRLYAISSDLAAIEGPLEACIHITSLYPYLDILWVQEQQGQVHDLQERVMPFAEELAEVVRAEEECVAANVDENDYTIFTSQDLAFELELVVQNIVKKISFIENQVHNQASV